MNHKLIVIYTNVLISAALSPTGKASKALEAEYQNHIITPRDFLNLD
ncbi:hypothetical protein B6N60_02149 [Richelia sinica FACHB-800]|uniref:Uncharacterized protein n=1 Tax=Richelia sinica FACHB-800 TaxID=1357546 RepID=A0A975Y4R7_9NOST|nr:hypothetical protein [Richelia sinica]MBD2667487.1 hypothetical protein [Richelia sinica FACHB-800]QXE23459.1 hypothetical protein B6N60_02149 [Richelia sinica FACHB-800]